MLGYPDWPNVITQVGPYKKKAGESESEREDIKKEATVREKRRFYTAGFEDRKRDHKLRNTDGL